MAGDYDRMLTLIDSIHSDITGWPWVVDPKYNLTVRPTAESTDPRYPGPAMIVNVSITELHHYYGRAGQSVAHMACNFHAPCAAITISQAEANARLSATAPDLYRLCLSADRVARGRSEEFDRQADRLFEKAGPALEQLHVASPWYLHPNYSLTVICRESERAFTFDEARANARVIAIAPDSLALVRLAVERFAGLIEPEIDSYISAVTRAFAGNDRAVDEMGNELEADQAGGDGEGLGEGSFDAGREGLSGLRLVPGVCERCGASTVVVALEDGGRLCSGCYVPGRDGV